MHIRLPAPGPGSTVAVTAFAVPYAAGFLLFGPLVDRFGPRAVMIASVAGVLVGTLVTVVAPVWPLFLAGRVVQGLAAAPFTPAILLLTQRRVPPARRLVTTSAVISSGMAAAAVAQVVAQLAEPVLGVRGVLVLSAAALAVSLVLVIVLIPAVPVSDSRGPTVSVVGSYRAMPRLLIHRRLTPLLLVALTYLTVFVGLYAVLQLTDRAGSAGELLVLRISALPAIAAIPLLSPMLVRIPGRRRMIVSIAAAAVSTALIGLLALTDHLSPLGFGVGMLLTAGAIAVAAPATVTEVMATASDATGAANALYLAAIFGGASLGTPIAAQVVSVAGTGDSGLGVFALVCTALLALACIAAVLASRTGNGRCGEIRS